MFTINQILKAVKGKLVCGCEHMEAGDISIDSRTIKRGDIFIAIKGNNFDGQDFIDQAVLKGCSCVIRAAGERRANDDGLVTKNEGPGTSGERRVAKDQGRGIAVIEVKDTIKALGDIARYQRQKFNLPVIAVTGSAGKTTVKDMISWVLSKKFNVLSNEGTKNNHIGLPLTLTNTCAKHDMAVLELGTNHPDEIAYLARVCQPNIGVITNIGPAHLEYFGDLKGVLKEKYALIRNLKKPYIALLNADDELLKRKVIQKTGKPVVFGFTIKDKSDFYADNIKSHLGKLEFRVNRASSDKIKNFRLNTAGYNNIYNALSAIAIARIFGMEYKEISLRLATFNFPAGRLNFIKFNNIRFINDTYNSNPLSLRHALDTLGSLNIKGRKIFVMGDMLELGNLRQEFHAQAGRLAAKICDVFITVGKLSNIAADAAKSRGFNNKNIFICSTSEEAREILFNTIVCNEDDIVLVKGSRGMKMEEIFRMK